MPRGARLLRKIRITALLYSRDLLILALATQFCVEYLLNQRNVCFGFVARAGQQHQQQRMKIPFWKIYNLHIYSSVCTANGRRGYERSAAWVSIVDMGPRSANFVQP